MTSGKAAYEWPRFGFSGHNNPTLFDHLGGDPLRPQAKRSKTSRDAQAVGIKLILLVAARDIDKREIARRGLSLSTVQDAIGIAIGGRDAGVVFEGDRRFQIVVRLSDAERNNIEALKNLPVALPDATPGAAATMVRYGSSRASVFPKAPIKSAGTTASGGSS